MKPKSLLPIGLILTLFAAWTIASVEAQPDKKSSWIAGAVYDGVSITCDLDDEQQMKNIGSRLDGAGMCVFTSIEHAARYQNLEQMRGWRDWCAQNYRGGGYPTKVDQLLKAWWAAKKIDPIPYLQYEGTAPEDLLNLCNKTNRMVCITYGYSPRYGRAGIAHMVNGVLYDKYGVVLDNNFPGQKNYEWMLPNEFVKRMRAEPSGRPGPAWIFIWTTPGAPPPPKAAPPMPRQAGKLCQCEPRCVCKNCQPNQCECEKGKCKCVP